MEFLGKLSFCKDSEHHKTKFEITQIQMTACIRIVYVEHFNKIIVRT